MKIYISLTTVPERIKNWSSFKENLISLVNQKTSEQYEIILTIPLFYNAKNEPYEIHDDLLNFINNNKKIILNRETLDHGPIVKIIGALTVSKNPEDILIVCDDDHKYHEEMLGYHLKMQEKYNGNAAICFRGDIPIIKVYLENSGDKRKYMLPSQHTYFPVKNDFLMTVPGHWHSVSYKRNFFGEDFVDQEFLSLSDNDDFLCGYYFKKKKIPIICAHWDKETDYRPVNEQGRPSYTFPILHPLNYPSSGFDEFRKLSNDHLGRARNELWEIIHNHDSIYEE